MRLIRGIMENKLFVSSWLIILFSAVLIIIIWCVLCIIIGKIKQRKAILSDNSEYVSIKQGFKFKYLLIIESVFALIMLSVMLFNHYSYYEKNFNKYEFDNGYISSTLLHRTKTFLPSNDEIDHISLSICIDKNCQEVNIYPDKPDDCDETDITYIKEDDGVTVHIKFSEYDKKTYKFYFDMFDMEEDYES